MLVICFYKKPDLLNLPLNQILLRLVPKSSALSLRDISYFLNHNINDEPICLYR